MTDTKPSDPLAAKSAEVPAIFSNRFIISVTPTTTRITFGEATIGLEAVPRTAVVLATTDALQLADLMMKLARAVPELSHLFTQSDDANG